MEVHCKQCGRFLAEADESFRLKLKCPACKSFKLYDVMLLWPENKAPEERSTVKKSVKG